MIARLTLWDIVRRSSQTLDSFTGPKASARPGAFFYSLCIGGHRTGRQAKPRHGATVAGFLRSVRGGRGPPSEPRQSAEQTRNNSAVKAHFCDRHHIASAMAELSSCLWIVPHTRSFYVPPKYSAPPTRGFFCAARLPASRASEYDS